MNRWRWITSFSLVAGLWLVCQAQAQGQDAPRAPRLPIPEGLPRYDLDVRIDVAGRLVRASERVTFTNQTSKEVTELVFHVYPRHRVEEADRPMVARTLEVLRLSPEEAMDADGRRLTVNEARGRRQESRDRLRPQE